MKILQNINRKIVLRSLTSEDLENIRVWKNENRHAFFYKEIITIGQQKKWYQAYLKEPFNYMFVIEYNALPIGSLGFRIIDNIADIYNIILGDYKYRRKKIMSLSLKVLFSYILNFHSKEITVKVLKTNKIGSNFYFKNDFIIKQEKDNYNLMQLSLSIFKPIKIVVSNSGSIFNTE